MRKKTFIGACLVALSLATVPLSATAQNYPTRAIKFIVPFAAGSATDSVARILGSKCPRRSASRSSSRTWRERAA